MPKWRFSGNKDSQYGAFNWDSMISDEKGLEK